MVIQLENYKMFERFLETEDLCSLPLSGSRYCLTLKGEVFDQSGNKLSSSTDSDGDSVLTIDWIDGVKAYKLATLMAVTFKRPKLSFKFWNQLSVMYADGNNQNLHPSNLVWKFPVGLGAVEHHGFSFIPMHSRYMINRDGVVFDTVTKKLLNGYANRGYVAYSLRPDIGPRTALFRHRALCLAFKEYPYNVDVLQVNHINGIPGDDRLENLEWVTGSENIQHAVNNGLVSVNKPLLVKNIKTGEIYEFNTVQETSDALGIGKYGMSKLLANPTGSFIHGDFEISYKNKDQHYGSQNKTSILVRNLFTKEVTEYGSIINCSKAIGLSKDMVMWRISQPIDKIYPDGLQIKRKTDNTPWHDPVNIQQEILEHSWIKEVLVRDAITGKVIEFPTQRAATKYLRIAEATIIQRLSRKDQPIYRNTVDGSYIQMKRKRDISPWRISSNPIDEYEECQIAQPVLVKNTGNNEIIEYPSAKACSIALNILATTMNWRLKSRGQKVYPDGLQFKYKNETTPFLAVNKDLQSLIASAPNSDNTI